MRPPAGATPRTPWAAISRRSTRACILAAPGGAGKDAASVPSPCENGQDSSVRSGLRRGGRRGGGGLAGPLLLRQPGGLALQAAQVIEPGAADLAVAHDLDPVDA